MTYEKTQDGKLKEIGEEVTYSPSSEFTRENINAQIARWDAAIADAETQKAVWENRLAQADILEVE